jgi:leucyl aminopeptidase
LALRRFVERTKAWAHFDTQAWTPHAKPRRPEGAEVLAARLLYDTSEARLGTGESRFGRKKPRAPATRRRHDRPWEGGAFDGRVP